MHFKTNNNFAKINPAITVFYYITVMVLVFVLDSTVLSAVAFLASSIQLIYINSLKQFFKATLPYLGFAVVLTVVNLIFTTVNDAVISALIILTLINTFQLLENSLNGNESNTLLSNILPQTTFVMSLLLRMLTTAKKDAKQIVAVQSSLGVSLTRGSFKERIKTAGVFLNALLYITANASFQSAAALMCRGYTLKPKRQKSKLSIKPRDVVLALFALLMLSITLICKSHGAEEIVTAATYLTFLCIPLLFNIVEDMRWHFMK